MIRLYGSLLTLALIFSACYGTATWIDDLSSGYIEDLHQAQELVQNNQWKEASDLTNQVYDHWNTQGFPLYTLLRHGDIDKILLCFQSVSQYLEEEDQEPYRANNAQLITQLQLLSEMEQLTVENIL